MKQKYNIDNFHLFLDNNPIILEFFNKEEILNQYEYWYANNGVLFHDFLWYLFNKAIAKNGEKLQHTQNEESFYDKLAQIQRAMARFRREEKASMENINKHHRLAFESENLSYKFNPLKTILDVVVITNLKGKCEYAKTVNGNKYSIENFLTDCHIATEVCTSNFGCSCCTALLPKRDKNGRLIRNIKPQKKQEKSLIEKLKNIFK